MRLPGHAVAAVEAQVAQPGAVVEIGRRFDAAAAGRLLEPVPRLPELRVAVAVVGGDALPQVGHQRRHDLLEAEDPHQTHEDVAGQQQQQQHPVRVEQLLAQPDGTQTACFSFILFYSIEKIDFFPGQVLHLEIFSSN